MPSAKQPAPPAPSADSPNRNEDSRRDAEAVPALSGERAWLKEIAAEGGRAVVAKHGAEHMARIGRAGSNAVLRKYGLRFYSEIAARNRGVKKQRPEEPEKGDAQTGGPQSEE